MNGRPHPVDGPLQAVCGPELRRQLAGWRRGRPTNGSGQRNVPIPRANLQMRPLEQEICARRGAGGCAEGRRDPRVGGCGAPLEGCLHFGGPGSPPGRRLGDFRLHDVLVLRDGEGWLVRRWTAVPGLWNNNMTTALRVPPFPLQELISEGGDYVVVQGYKGEPRRRA